ncbi:hypothetical protein BC332_23346 [Capsicum chinense]|nr:hypothetical protein BC332_23346 [Capsicum chinense]
MTRMKTSPRLQTHIQLSGMGSTLAYVNDAYHWICMSGNYSEVSRTYSLVSFSISNEMYREILLPEQILRLKGNITIGISILDGRLCAYSTYAHQNKEKATAPWLQNHRLHAKEGASVAGHSGICHAKIRVGLSSMPDFVRPESRTLSSSQPLLHNYSEGRKKMHTGFC